METKQIPQFPEHSISECGTIILNHAAREIKQGKQILKGKQTGYLYATMLASDYSYNKRVAVHRLVAFAWLPNPPTDKHVWINHKNGNKADNRACNLEWSTISQNIQHAFDTGLKITPKGKNHWRYGKKVSNETKKVMSEQKIGDKHPKFKGYWFVNFKRFASVSDAVKFTGISRQTIKARCLNEDFRLKGYYFVPKVRETSFQKP